MKVKTFFKKHWIDVVLISGIIGLLSWLVTSIFFRFNFSKKIQIFYNHFVVNEGYERLIEGMKNTFIIAIAGLVIGIIIGTLIAVFRVMPPTNRFVKYVQKFCSIYVAFFRGTPIVVQLLLGYFILFPLMQMKITPVMACVWVFGLNSGAYISEIMRSGIQSVDGGQLEAARAVGMPFSVSMLKVVVPQAIKNILPTLGNEFIALIKDTSVVGFIATLDLTQAFKRIGSQNYEFVVPYLLLALIYLVLVLVVTGIIKLIERRMKRSDRRN